MSGCPAVTTGQQLSDFSSLSRERGWVTLPGAVGPARGFTVFLTLEGRAGWGARGTALGFPCMALPTSVNRAQRLRDGGTGRSPR